MSMWKIEIKSLAGEAFAADERKRKLRADEMEFVAQSAIWPRNFIDRMKGTKKSPRPELECLRTVLTCAFMIFVYEGKRMWNITRYESGRELTGSELKLLEEWTKEQWSTGEGEDFELFPCAHVGGGGREEVYMCCWKKGSPLITTQSPLVQPRTRTRKKKEV